MTNNDLNRALSWLWLLVAALFACSDSGPSTNSESHFLSACTNDEQCPDDLACLCGLCSRGCASDPVCSDLSAASCADRTAPPLVDLCVTESSSMPGVCLAECGTRADCRAVGSDLTCRSNRCVPDTGRGDIGFPDPVPDVGDGGLDVPVDSDANPDEPRNDGDADAIALDVAEDRAAEPDVQRDTGADTSDGDLGGAGVRGAPCEGPEDCDGLPCTMSFCGEACSAPSPECPDGATCLVPGDISGICLPSCGVCGLSACPAGMSCTLSNTGGSVCKPDGLPSVTNPCLDQVCGADFLGCHCGICDFEPVSGGCFMGDCADVCPGTPCIDAFDLGVCEGQEGYRTCPDDADHVQLCTCSGGGEDAWFSCGECLEP